jgi:hypothetical protein
MSDVKKPLDALLDTMDRLTLMLEGENANLKAHHPETIERSIEEKLSLGRTFERQMQQLGSFSNALASLPPEEKQEITARAERFRAAVTANETALQAAQRTAERVITHIVEAVRKQSSARQAHYSRPTMARPRRMATPISVSINQTF